MEPNDVPKEKPIDKNESLQKLSSSKTPPKKPHVSEQASPIRTYSTDLAHAVRKDEMSVIKAAMAEEKRRHEDELQFSAKSPKNKLYIGLSIAIILITIFGTAAVYFIKNTRQPEIIPQQAQIPSIIAAENTTSIEVGGASEGKIIDLTRTAVNNIANPEGKIINIYFTDATSGVKQIIGTQTFLAGIRSEIPSDLLATLDKNFMLGMYTKDAIRHPFLILRTNDFQIAFASMYDWERKIFSDFYLPFNLPGSEDTFTNKFSDLLVDNKDTRVLLRDDNSVGFIYGFVDDKSLIIADSVEAFREVLRRVQSVR